jgi:hypothetical protein
MCILSQLFVLGAMAGRWRLGAGTLLVLSFGVRNMLRSLGFRELCELGSPAFSA